MPVGRKKLYGPIRGVRLPVKLDETMMAALAEGEQISDFIRQAVKREIARRRRKAERQKKA